jgi:phage portal protein BeeE
MLALPPGTDRARYEAVGGIAPRLEAKAIIPLTGEMAYHHADNFARNLVTVDTSAVHRTGMDRGYAHLARLALANPHANRALRLIAQMMAGLPLLVQRQDPETGEWESADDHGEVPALIDRPNPRTTRQELFDRIVLCLYAGGEFWIDLADAALAGPNAGRPRTIRLISPDEFESFIYGDADEVVGYRFVTRRRRRKYTRTVEEAVHVRLPHPTDDDRGLPIYYGGRALLMMEQAAAWNEATARSLGRVPAYWSPKNLPDGRQLDPTQQAAAQAWFSANAARSVAAGVDMVLSGAFEQVSDKVTPRDAEWGAAQQFALRQVATLHGLAPTLLGDEKAGSLTDSGVDSEVRAALLLTVIPLAERVFASLTRALLPPGFRLWYDRDEIDVLNEDVNQIHERVRRNVGGPLLSLAEGRAAIGYAHEGPEAEAAMEAVTASRKPTNPFGGDREMADRDPPEVRALRALPPEEFEALKALFSDPE